MKIEHYLKEYLKKKLQVDNVENYVFPGKKSSFFFGENGVVSRMGFMLKPNVKVVLFSFGQNDLSSLVYYKNGKILIEHEGIASLAESVKKDFCLFSSNYSNCVSFLLPLFQRKINQQCFTRFPISKNQEWIDHINTAISLFNTQMSSCPCHVKNIYIVPCTPNIVDEVLCNDGLHLTKTGQESSLALAISYWKTRNIL